MGEAPVANSRPRILCVDDEEFVLDGMRDMLRRAFHVHTATSAAEGIALLRKEPDAYAVILSDMRMPGMLGAEFLREARTVAPAAVRMLLTGHSDIDSAIRAVNDAQLFRFLTKPCESEQLVRACIAALAQHRLITSERVLLEQTLRGSVNSLIEMLALASPAAFGRAGRVRELVRKVADQLAPANRWEIEVAAMLAHVGAVTLPPDTAEKLYAGDTLTAEEQEMVERMPHFARRLLNKIPRLEGVLAIIDTYHRPLDTVDFVPAGARLLKMAVDYEEMESSGLTDVVALGALQGRGCYDADLITALGNAIGVGGRMRVVRELSLSEIHQGMMLADDVRSVTGSLLVARGQTVTEQVAERLANLPHDQIRQPLRVFEAE